MQFNLFDSVSSLLYLPRLQKSIVNNSCCDMSMQWIDILKKSNSSFELNMQKTLQDLKSDNAQLQQSSQTLKSDNAQLQQVAQTLKSDNAQLQQVAQALEAQKNELSNELSAMHASHSWRLTAPLRSLLKLFH